MSWSREQRELRRIMREQRTQQWQVPARKFINLNFQTVDWAKFEGFSGDPMDFHRSSINGHTIWILRDHNRQVFGVFYGTKRFGTVNQHESFSDVFEYSQADPNFPRDWKTD